ncbi:hypothetical protein ABZ860_00860 [Microbispora sp. NPDC046973]|uniref:hypothetical protein n=1 Tax=Microbispora sp. NPDC046973 TaxID=3155022 RepID=UPI0033D286E0
MEEKINRISLTAALIGASVSIDFDPPGSAGPIVWEATDLDEFLQMVTSQHPSAVRILTSEWTEEDVVQLIDDNSMWLPEDETLEIVEPGIEPLVVEARDRVGTVVQLTATFVVDRGIHRWTYLDDACSDLIDRFVLRAQEILNDAASMTERGRLDQLEASSRQRLDELAGLFKSQAKIAFHTTSQGWSWPVTSLLRASQDEAPLGAFERCQFINDEHASLCTAICDRSPARDEGRCKRLAERGIYHENKGRWSQELLRQLLEDETYLCGSNSQARWERCLQLVGNLVEEPFAKPDYWYATFSNAEGVRRNRIIPARKMELERSIPRLALDLASSTLFERAKTKMERRQLARALLLAADPLGAKGSITVLTNALLAEVERI